MVDRRFEIGPRELVLPALSAGFIEFVPEYLGTALQFLSLGAAAQGGDASSITGRSMRRCAPAT